MRQALVGVLGHVDHGKTALVRALTGTDTDRLPEEKARGISILPGYARLAAGDAEIDLVDVPGHERFVRAMVAGASAMNAALLVVDAQEGVRAQTREHAEIAALLGVERGVIAIARADRAAPEEAARSEAQALALLAKLGLGPWPALSCSAVRGDGMAALATLLLDLAEPAPPGEASRAWLPVDRAFHRPGTGLVATGALRQGRLALGDEVEIWPGPRRATIRGMQSHGRVLEVAGPGRRLAVALRGAGAAREGALAAPGDALAAPGLLAASVLLDVQVRVLASAPRALRRGEALRFLCGTAEAGSRLHLLGQPEIAPGEVAVAQVKLDAPLAVPVRAGFVLRLPSPSRSVAGGVVLDPEAPRRRPSEPDRLTDLARLEAPAAAMASLRFAGPRGMDATRLARLAGGAWPEAAVRLTGGLAIDAEALARLEALLLAAVAAGRAADPLGPGPDARSVLREALPEGAPGEAVAARLVARKALLLAHGRFTLPVGPALGEPERRVLRQIEATWREAGLSPPEAGAVATGDRLRIAAIRHLVGTGTLLRAPDAVQKREFLFHREALAEARRRLAPPLAAAPQGLTVSECNKVLGLTRRHAVPLLERLDADGFTRREGDRRHLRDG